MYYIISLTHTMRADKYLTLWRADNKGYCWSKIHAGEYETPEQGYHDNESNMPISLEEADKLFQLMPYDGTMRPMIKNTKETWQKLRVKMSKDGLKRILVNAS